MKKPIIEMSMSVDEFEDALERIDVYEKWKSANSSACKTVILLAPLFIIALIVTLAAAVCGLFLIARLGLILALSGWEWFDN